MLGAASGAALLLGFLTPAAGPVAGLSVLLIAGTSPAPFDTVPLDRVAALIVLAIAVALALLGPGAHSMDAYLFGRREIIIPHD